MNIIYLAVGKIKPYENNTKDHPPEQVERIAKSIQEFGFDQPIVVDKDYVVVKGHGRLAAAKLLKMKEVPCYVTEASQGANLANRILDNEAVTTNYNITALREDLLTLSESGNIGLALFTESTIPPAIVNNGTGEMSLFSLATTHTCPKCTYRW